MLACPYCSESPGWHYARNTTMTKGANHFWFSGCVHAKAFGPSTTVTEAQQPALAEKWDAHAEELFRVYTATWTEAQRAAFKARLWPDPTPIIPIELFDRYREETPTFQKS